LVVSLLSESGGLVQTSLSDAEARPGGFSPGKVVMGITRKRSKKIIIWLTVAATVVALLQAVAQLATALESSAHH
jgi:hypothetical protein